MRAISTQTARQLASPAPVRPQLRPRLANASRARPAVVRVAAGLFGGLEARLEQVVGSLSAEAAGAATRVQHTLLGLALAAQRLVRWVQLAAMALGLQQQQQRLAYAGGAGAVAAEAPVAPAAAAAPAPVPPPAAAVIGFISAATTGAVEQLRYTLTDASQGIESRMSAIERTASAMQGTLFQAAQAHSEAVRSNPQGGMWKQPCVASVISEEERLRQAVFDQIYAELLQKDNAQISFNVQGQP